jgi:mannose/fructose/N-acetylgalactosamine-specific phosphotransferase system component IID
MRINKVLPTYVRLMIAGLVVFFVVLNIIACQTTWVFSKPGITEGEFNKDKYECMRENQQVSSAAYVNAVHRVM